MLRLTPGDSIDGKYRLDTRIGTGGTAEVWAAYPIEMADCRVAIKFAVDPSVAPEKLLRRWRREVATLRKLMALNDPRIVRLLGFGFNPMPYLVMDRYPHNLDRHLALTLHQRISVDVKMGWIRQILVGVQAVHRAGFAHGDIKPANVLVQPDADNGGYRFAVSDFGLARCRGTVIGESRDWGTLTFTAPELFASLGQSTQDIDAQGEAEDDHAGDADAGSEEESVVTMATLGEAKRADLYALGIVAYAVLSGRTPCEEMTEAAVIEWHQREFPDPKLLIDAHVPRPIADFIAARVLHREPNRRPSIDEFIDVLEQRASHAPVPAVVTGPRRSSLTAPSQASADSRPSAPAPSSDKRSFRRGVVATGLLAAAVLAVGLSFGMTAIRSKRVRSTSETTPLHMVHLAGTYSQGADSETIDRDCRQLPVGATDCERDLLDRVSPPRTVTVSPFDIDEYESTNAKVIRTCNRIHCKPMPEDHPSKDAPKYRYGQSPDGRVRWFDMHKHNDAIYYDDTNGVENGEWKVRPGFENLPFTTVTWAGAVAMCNDDGGKLLPTEAQWELAAGGIDHRSLPWPSVGPLSCDQANIARDPQSKDGAKGGVCRRSGPPALQPVGSSSHDRTPEGVSDMGGNAAEWVRDSFTPKYAPCEGSPCLDPLTQNASGLHSFRGGGWSYPPEKALTYYRTQLPSDSMRTDVGFRCVHE